MLCSCMNGCACSLRCETPCHDTLLMGFISEWGTDSRFCCAAAKLIIISNNTPPIRKSEIEYYAMLSKTGVHHYMGSAYLPPQKIPLVWRLQQCAILAAVSG